MDRKRIEMTYSKDFYIYDVNDTTYICCRRKTVCLFQDQIKHLVSSIGTVDICMTHIQTFPCTETENYRFRATLARSKINIATTFSEPQQRTYIYGKNGTTYKCCRRRTIKGRWTKMKKWGYGFGSKTFQSANNYSSTFACLDLKFFSGW